MGPANVIKFLAQREQSPWRGKSNPPGPRGLHPAGALARTHWNHENKTQSRREPLQDIISTKPQGECSHSPRGSGATVGYHKKGHPKQEPKRLPKPCKYQSQRTTTRSRPILRLARSPRRNDSLPRRGPLAEALSCQGPAPQGLGRVTDSLIRPRPRE